jgi:hypothetical protein
MREHRRNHPSRRRAARRKAGEAAADGGFDVLLEAAVRVVVAPVRLVIRVLTSTLH